MWWERVMRERRDGPPIAVLPRRHGEKGVRAMERSGKKHAGVAKSMYSDSRVMKAQCRKRHVCI